MVVFERATMLAGSNLLAERIKSFAVAWHLDDGRLQEIIAKPSGRKAFYTVDEFARLLNRRPFTVRERIGNRPSSGVERACEYLDDAAYRVGYNYVTKCTNSRQAGLQLLDDLHGDFSTFLDVLVAQPFEPGSAKSILTKAAAPISPTATADSLAGPGKGTNVTKPCS